MAKKKCSRGACMNDGVFDVGFGEVLCPHCYDNNRPRDTQNATIMGVKAKGETRETTIIDFFVSRSRGEVPEKKKGFFD